MVFILAAYSAPQFLQCFLLEMLENLLSIWVTLKLSR